MNYQKLYRVREPICKNANKGSYMIHYFSAKDKADNFAKGKGTFDNDAEVLVPNSYRVENGYVVCGKIDK